MTDRNKQFIAATPMLLFLLAQIVLFPLIQFTPGGVSGNMSYLAIIIVALFALFACKCTGTAHFIRFGIFATLAADYFLIIAEDAQLEGVLCFIVVQLLYCFYLIFSESRIGVCTFNTTLRIALSVLLVVFAFALLGEDTDTLSIVSVIYYANLISNIVFAFMLGKGNRLFAVGLVLFAMCDLCIGMQVLSEDYLDNNALSFFYSDMLNLPWVFYQPSQVLIALSLFFKKHKKQEGTVKSGLFVYSP